MKLQEPCTTLSVAKFKEYFTVYLLVVNGPNLGTKNLASLSVDVCKADKIDLTGRQPATQF